MKTIELKVNECVSLHREITALEKGNIKLPASTSYWLGRLSAHVEPIAKMHDKARVDLVKKYGTEDGKGNITVSKENAAAFAEEFTEMEEQVEQVTTKQFRIEDFGNADIPISFFHAAWMIVDADVPENDKTAEVA